MSRTKTEECVRDGVTYRVETTWDDKSGNAEIREFTLDGQLVRSCDWRTWPEDEWRENQIGEAVWFDASGAEIERQPLRDAASPQGSFRNTGPGQSHLVRAEVISYRHSVAGKSAR